MAEQAQPVASRVERDETPVMFLRTEDEPASMREGWERLENLVGLRGRKFYGTFDPSTKEYRVCVQVRDGDDPAALGLETAVIPGGAYLRVRLHGDPPAVYERIGPTFQELARTAASDVTRPEIEFYRRVDEIDLFSPVL